MTTPLPTDEELDPELAEVLAMTDEQVTLSLARAGISPADMSAHWRQACEKWAADPDPVVSEFGRAMLQKETP